MAEWEAQLVNYLPLDKAEKDALALFRDAEPDAREAMRGRDAAVHLTVSAMVLTPDLRRTLLAFHRIYRSYAWTGGHVDGADDFLQKAREELEEETGLQKFWPLTRLPVSLDLLPVRAHRKRGRKVEAHRHLNLTYAFLAPERQTLRPKPDENTAVAWFDTSELPSVCSEPHMLPVYEKVLARVRAVSDAKADAVRRLPDCIPTWFATAARELPWRRDRDPYHVWLSEIMLQQTRVEAVKGYYERFLAAFPTLESLARAPEDKLLKLWEGLGYYNRARNLQKAARQILERHGGIFPQTHEEIAALAGIGPYTAGAIASICFDAPTPAVDGNVLRVVSRLTEDFAPVDDASTRDRVQDALKEVYPAGRCGVFTQGLMELGATVCLPNGTPRCDLCPAAQFCLGKKNGSLPFLPVRTPKKARRIEEKTVFLLTNKGRLALQKRGEDGVLSRMWELPNLPGFLSPQQALEQAERWQTQPETLLRETHKTHVFTHIEWRMTGYAIACGAAPPGFVWADADELAERYALPTAFKQFL